MNHGIPERVGPSSAGALPDGPQSTQRRRSPRNPTNKKFVAELSEQQTVTIQGIEPTLERLIALLELLLSKARRGQQLGLGLLTFLMMLRDQSQPPGKAK